MAEIGDKYIIEIGDKLADGLYKIKGFNTLVFDEYGLEKLKRFNGDGWSVAQHIALMGEIGRVLVFNDRDIEHILLERTQNEARNAIIAYMAKFGKLKVGKIAEDLKFGTMFVDKNTKKQIVVVGYKYANEPSDIISVATEDEEIVWITVDDLYKRFDKVIN